MRVRGAVLAALLIAMLAAACSEVESERFKNRVNEATADQVAKRYGAPHRSEQRAGGTTVWTYFERGSGTTGYSGFARGGFCHAYVLTFDQANILRDWRQDDCPN